MLALLPAMLPHFLLLSISLLGFIRSRHLFIRIHHLRLKTFIFKSSPSNSCPSPRSYRRLSEVPTQNLHFALPCFPCHLQAFCISCPCTANISVLVIFKLSIHLRVVTESWRIARLSWERLGAPKRKRGAMAEDSERKEDEIKECRRESGLLSS